MKQLKLKGDLNDFYKLLQEPGHKDFYLFNKFRHDFTTYEKLHRGYTQQGNYLNLVTQYVDLVEKYLPLDRFNKNLTKFVREKLDDPRNQ